jgi:NitT/TauT family transport system substrate-binding protein
MWCKFASIAAIAAAFCLPAGNKAAAQTNIQFGVTSAVASNAPHFIAMELGFYKEQGLNVTWISAGSANNVIQQVAAGSLNMGWAATDQAIRAIMRGAPVRIIAGAGAVPVFRVLGAKDVKTWADLKGKRISVGGPSDQTLYFFRVMARKNGLGDKDYDFVYGGSTPDRFAHLLSNTVGASVLTNPLDFTALDQGYPDLGLVSDVFKTWTQNNIEVNTSWAKANRPAVVAFLKAHIKAINYFYDPRNEASVVAIMQKVTKDTEATTKRTYDYYIKEGVLARSGELSLPGIQAVLDALREFGDVKQPISTADLVDASFLQEAAGK